jgi:thioredoxin 1
MSQLNPLSSGEFEEKVLQAQKLVLVDFGAPWCGPCKSIDPIIAELAGEFDGKADFYSVNVDQNPDLAMRYSVMGVPTLIFFRDGKPVEQLTGFRPKQILEKTLLKHL